MSNRAERRRAMSKRGQAAEQDMKRRTGPLIALVLGIIGGAVLIFTHGPSVGGPVIAGAIILPLGWATLTNPPAAKANTEHAAALKFGK